MRDSLRRIALSLVLAVPVAGCATGSPVTGPPAEGDDDFAHQDSGGSVPDATLKTGSETGAEETGAEDTGVLDGAEDASALDGTDDAGSMVDGSGQSDATSEAGSTADGGDGGQSVDGGTTSDAAQDGSGAVDASEGGSEDASLDATGTGDAGQTDAGAADGAALDASHPDAGSGVPHCPQSTNDSTGIYVTPTGADATGCGASRGAPCLTIAGAIASTSYFAGRDTIYVGAGTYVEKVTPPAGVTIMGGWQVSGSTWTFDCGTTPEADVIVQAPSTSNVTVLASSVGGAVTLSTLTIESKATANAGESLYGVFATGTTTQITLTNVAVTMAKAGDGQTPAQAGSGSAAAATCTAGDGASATTPGSTGTGGPIGTFSATGFTSRLRRHGCGRHLG